MAVLGRWTGGAKTQGNLPEAWTAPSNLFDVEARNDASTYTFTASTSTLTLPSTGLADGYLLTGRYEYEDTSNGRFNPQGQIVQASGTGTFVGGPSGGYNRDTSEDRSYVHCWAFVDSPSASSTYQFQWKADTDDSLGGTVRSSFDVIPLYYSDFGAYTSTSAALYGGTTPNQVTGFTGTDGTNITLSSNVVTLAGDNKRYLALGSQFFEGRGGRTQRWHGFRVDGTANNAAKAYSYYRNTANDESGEIFTHLIETATSDVTLDQFCYRGDGVTAGLGGADADGSTPSVGSHAIVVLELNDSAEVFHSIDGTGGVDLNVTGPVDQSVCRTSDITFNDTASWTRASDTAMNAEVAMDALLGANISAAQEVVSVTSRWTAQAQLTVNGTEDSNVFAGDYARNNQGSIDTFGWSANFIGYAALALGDDVGVSVQELSGGEDGGQYEVQPGWSGFWGINLDTLEGAGGGTDALTADDVESASELTSPSIGQTHSLTSTSVESNSELTSPSIGQVHSLSATDVQSTSELSTPALTEVAGTHNLNAEDVEFSSELSTPSLSQVHALTADDVESASELTAPSMSGSSALTADDVEAQSEITQPSLAQVHALNAVSVESNTELTTPTLADVAPGVDALSADDVESRAELSLPRLSIPVEGGANDDDHIEDDEEILLVIKAFLAA